MDNTQTLVNAVLPIVVAILFAFVAGGATIATLFALVVKMILNSPVILATLEKLYAGLAPEWQQTIKDAVKVGEEVTDDEPTTVPAG